MRSELPQRKFFANRLIVAASLNGRNTNASKSGTPASMNYLSLGPGTGFSTRLRAIKRNSYVVALGRLLGSVCIKNRNKFGSS